MDLSAFIESHVKQLRRDPAGNPPHLVTSLVVTKVAKQCVATRAGVEKGDLLTLVDGIPAGRHSKTLFNERVKKRLLTFYSPKRKESTELATTGIEIGVELDYTAEAVRARFKPDDVDPSALERLWELGDCQGLLELSRRALAAKGNQDTPAVLFEGVGLWESGQYAAGMERISDYAVRLGRNWTMNFLSIAIHYFGLDDLRQGRREAGLDKLQQAFDYFALESTADAIAEVTGVRPPLEKPVWVGKPFPVDYALPTIEGEKKTVALRPALAAMGPRQLLCVCLLASYRSNGPYWELLGRYHNFVTFFSPFLAGMHSITMEPKRYANRASHYKREDEVRALPLPFELLLEGGELAEALGLTRSPFVLLVDQQGTIVCEGALESVDFWNALAR